MSNVVKFKQEKQTISESLRHLAGEIERGEKIVDNLIIIRNE